MNDPRAATPIIHLAQYLTGLTAAQDPWREAGEALVKLFDTDLCAVGGAGPGGHIATHDWVFADPDLASAWAGVAAGAGPGELVGELHQCIAETLESGFLLSRIFPAPVPLAMVFLPIVQENHTVAVLLIGHRGTAPLPREGLDLYLAAAGLVATTVTRLAAERELREHRQHLAELVEQRTAELLNANRQLEQEIGERRSNERIMAARLHLIACADGQSLAELLRATLDEAEALTGSRIGFYHFVEPDQRSLSLQAWSSNTMAGFCSAEPTERHYALDQAGIWADCIRMARPLIHNDYESLPHRKPLPPGHARLIRELTVPVIRAGQIKAVVGVGNKPAAYTEGDVSAVAVLADLAWDIVESRRLRDLLERQATTDELTGLANRRHFLELAGRELRRALRQGRPLAVALIDLDHFKEINDTHGHACGDRALVASAQVCRENLRDSDIFARFGGDELVLLLPDTDLAQACAVLERMRLALAARPLVQDGVTVALTISAGVAALPEGATSLDAILADADQALYRAKEAGRNRIAGCRCTALIR